MARRSVLVLGGSGFVGSRVLELWRGEDLNQMELKAGSRVSAPSHAKDFEVTAPSHAQLDVLDERALASFLEANESQVVVNLAAGAHVDQAEAEVGDKDGRVYALNAIFPAHLARQCRELGKHLVHISTDYVFDGTNDQRPYREDDPPNPISWYAVTKYAGEQAVLDAGAPVCVARIEMPFSGRNHSKSDLPRTVVGRLKAGEPISGVVDQRISPIFLDDAVHALGKLVAERYQGIVHVAAADWTTPFRFAQSIATRLNLDPSLVQPEEFRIFAGMRAARRPQHSWLDVSLFAKLYGNDLLRPVEAELDAWQDQLLSMPSRA